MKGLLQQLYEEAKAKIDDDSGLELEMTEDGILQLVVYTGDGLEGIDSLEMKECEGSIEVIYSGLHSTARDTFLNGASRRQMSCSSVLQDFCRQVEAVEQSVVMHKNALSGMEEPCFRWTLLSEKAVPVVEAAVILGVFVSVFTLKADRSQWS